MKYTATVSYKAVTETFVVADAEHGQRWATTRAIAHFLYKHPEFEKEVPGLSAVDAEKFLRANGIIATLIRHE